MAKGEATLLLRIKSAGEDVLDRVTSLIGNLAKIGTVAFGAISAAVVKSIAEYREQEEATNALTRAMINNGTYSKALVTDYQNQAKALEQVTLYEGEHITAAQAALAQQAGQIKVTKELTEAILDFATANKMDASSAAALVGKSIGTATNALGRYGIEVNTAASQSEKMSQVLDGLNRKFGGQAQAAASGLGALDQFQKTINNLFETLGERLAPAVIVVTKSLNDLVSNTGTANTFIDSIVGGFEFLVKLSTSVAFAFQSLGTTIGGTLGTIIGSMQLLIEGKFKAAGKALVDGFEAIGEERARIQEKYNNKILEIDNAFNQEKQANEAEEEARLAEALVKKEENKIVNEQMSRSAELERLIAAQEIEMGIVSAHEGAKEKAILDAQIKTAQKKYEQATTANAKLAALEEIHRLNELKKQQIADQLMLENRKSTLSTIATLQGENNATLAAIGKAAAITQIAIETPVAIAKALSAFPPPANFVAAGVVGVAMAAQAAKVAGVQLAEGGIVRARPGGTQATIGEGGQDEAVIPLDKAGMLGGGNTIIINSYGGLLGNEREAYEFAKAVDNQLLELRRNNESRAFDTGVI